VTLKSKVIERKTSAL